MNSYKPYFKVRPELQQVTKEAFDKFLHSYPNHLEEDYYMGVVTYNDFSIAPMWPDSIVASRDIEFEYDPNRPGYARIATNMKEVFESIEKN